MGGELVAAPSLDPKAAANARIDLDPLHLPVGSREQPLADRCRIEPGVEEAPRRRGDPPLDGDRCRCDVHDQDSWSNASRRAISAWLGASDPNEPVLTSPAGR